MSPFNYSPYKGGYRKKSIVFRALLILFLVLVSVLIILFILLQDYIVFTKDGIRIELNPGQGGTVENTDGDTPDLVTVENPVQTKAPYVPDKPGPDINEEADAIPELTTIRAAAFPLGPTPYTDTINTISALGGVNALVFDIKAESGALYYPSGSGTAAEIKAVGTGDLQALIAAAHEKDMLCILRISCFKDKAYTGKHYDRCISTSGGVMWLDRYNDSWINPYKTEAWDYIAEIAAEVSAAKPDGILLDNAGFPGAGQLSLIDYGGADADYSRTDCIDDFLKKMRDSIAAGIPAWVCCDYDAIMSGGLTGLDLVRIRALGFGIMPVFTASQSGVLSYPAVERNANLPVQMETVLANLEASKPEKDKGPPVLPMLRMFTDQPRSALSSRVLPALKTLRGTFNEFHLVMTNNGDYTASLFE